MSVEQKKSCPGASELPALQTRKQMVDLFRTPLDPFEGGPSP